MTKEQILAMEGGGKLGAEVGGQAIAHKRNIGLILFRSLTSES